MTRILQLLTLIVISFFGILGWNKGTAGDSVIVNTATASTGGVDFVRILVVDADNWMVMGYSGTWTAD